jgi:hypothetical protein
MSLDQLIVKLLKSEGYKINEVIRTALEDFVDVCEDEMENEIVDNDDDEDFENDDD